MNQKTQNYESKSSHATPGSDNLLKKSSGSDNWHQVESLTWLRMENPVMKVGIQKIKIYSEPGRKSTVSKSFTETSKKGGSGHRKTVPGRLSNSAKKRFENALIIQYHSPELATFYTGNPDKMVLKNIFFRTFTFPETDHQVTAREARKIINEYFFPMVRRKHPDFEAIIKFEKQNDYTFQGVRKEFGGNIHFHVLDKEELDYGWMTRLWWSILRRHGYLDQYTRKYPGKNPRGVDQKRITSDGMHARYISKYMMKDADDLRGWDGPVWMCTSVFKDVKPYVAQVNSDIVRSIDASIAEGKVKARVLKLRLPANEKGPGTEIQVICEVSVKWPPRYRGEDVKKYRRRIKKEGCYYDPRQALPMEEIENIAEHAKEQLKQNLCIESDPFTLMERKRRLLLQKNSAGVSRGCCGVQGDYLKKSSSQPVITTSWNGREVKWSTWELEHGSLSAWEILNN